MGQQRRLYGLVCVRKRVGESFVSDFLVSEVSMGLRNDSNCLLSRAVESLCSFNIWGVTDKNFALNQSRDIYSTL